MNIQELFISVVAVAALCTIASSCANSEPSSESTSSNFTLKMMQSTGESQFTQLAYQCDECSFEQLAAIDAPEGWTKSPTQVLLPEGIMRSVPSFDGVPNSIDFVDEIPGEEFRLIAKVLDATILQMGPKGLVVVAEVMRDTVFTYPSGGRVHELTDPDGTVFVLFVFEVESKDFVEPDFEAEDALEGHPVPEGWTYTTRILDEDLIMEVDDVATVLSIRGDKSSAWQKR